MNKRIRGYTWQQIRKRILTREPLCRMCKEEGRYTEAVEVDHITPLVKDGTNDISNLQPLCKRCHIKKTHNEQGKRTRPTIGEDGYPINEDLP